MLAHVYEPDLCQSPPLLHIPLRVFLDPLRVFLDAIDNCDSVN
jgi:hypothetical protein